MTAYPLSSRKDGILQEEKFLLLGTAGGGRTAILRVMASEGKKGFPQTRSSWLKHRSGIMMI
jgi:Holliday junction resolvasome RuvABC ATP-dependent DNA helicase subunit